MADTDIGLPTAEPGDEAQLAELIRSARSDGTPLVPRGLGSSMAWCRPEHRSNARFLSTLGLAPEGGSGIVEYVPGDGTLTALGCARMDDLRAAVGEGGHELTPCLAGASTLGGVLAAGRSGPDRMGFGPLRHHVLGMRVVDGHGRVTRSGGRLVKNVTGFDMHRLHVGARGTLGVIVEASLRLMPKAESEVLLTTAPFASTSAAVEAALGVRALPGVRPRALFVAGGAVHVLLAGRTVQIEVEERAVASALGAPPERAPEDATERMTRASEQRAAVRLSTAPSLVARALHAVSDLLGEAAASSAYVEPDAAVVDLDRAAVDGHDEQWVAGLLSRFDRGTVRLEPREDASPTLAAACRARHDMSPQAVAWTRRLLEELDPEGVFQTPHFPAAPGTSTAHG